MVHSILLAFMWEQAETKADLLPYYQTLDRNFKVLAPDVMLDETWGGTQMTGLPTALTDVNDAENFESVCYIQSVNLFRNGIPPQVSASI
jgi:hypothetical protein